MPRKPPSNLYDHTNNKVLAKEQRLCISIDHPFTSTFILFSLPYPTEQPQYTFFSVGTTFHSRTKTTGIAPCWLIPPVSHLISCTYISCWYPTDKERKKSERGRNFVTYVRKRPTGVSSTSNVHSCTDFYVKFRMERLQFYLMLREKYRLIVW